MKMDNIKEASYFYTEKASELTRQLAYSGIAIIWIFKEQNTLKIPSELIFPLILLALTLILDFLQYRYGARVWMRFHREKEIEGIQESDEIKGPYKYTKSINMFWNAKTFLIAFCYVYLIIFLIISLPVK